MWDTLDTSVPDPMQWGWRKVNDQYVPIKNDLPPAPDRLLNFVRCNCTTESKKPCAETHAAAGKTVFIV